MAGAGTLFNVPYMAYIQEPAEKRGHGKSIFTFDDGNDTCYANRTFSSRSSG